MIIMRLNRLFVFIVALLAVAGRAQADGLSVENVPMQAGETRQVAIVLNNSELTYAAFQFDLVLPEGISVAKNERNKLVASLNSDRIDDHTLNVSQKDERTYRFMSFSMSNSAFFGNDGTLVYVTLIADNSFGQSAQATITSQVFTEPNGTQHKWSDTTFNIGKINAKCSTPTIIYKKGRLEFSCSTPGARFVSSVTTTDVKAESEGSSIDLTASYIVTVYAVAAGYDNSDSVTASIKWGDGTLEVENITVESTKDNKGDVNGDGTVDVSDYIGVANLILFGTIDGK